MLHCVIIIIFIKWWSLFPYTYSLRCSALYCILSANNTYCTLLGTNWIVAVWLLLCGTFVLIFDVNGVVQLMLWYAVLTTSCVFADKSSVKISVLLCVLQQVLCCLSRWPLVADAFVSNNRYLSNIFACFWPFICTLLAYFAMRKLGYCWSVDNF